MTAEQLDSFALRVVFARGRTGFQATRKLHAPVNSVIAGRYQVCRHIDSAVSSDALHCVDLHEGDRPVCLKVVKNDKDLFDQSLDEIQLLRYMGARGDAERHHFLAMHDCFYYREHLFIVSELLGENLYQFSQRLKEGGLPPYFTPVRVRGIMHQCLEALSFMNRLSLMHCDVKPENIAMRDYAQGRVKLIDFGSACFTSDRVAAYMQSRFYRAPEVLLGLPHFGPGVDTWSLGAVLAELLTGNVLFQSDTCAALLARITAVAGAVPPDMVVAGRESPRYYTSAGALYEREGAGTSHVQLLRPKRTHLRARLRQDDPLLLDFAALLLRPDPCERPFACEALAHPWLHASGAADGDGGAADAAAAQQ
ncbi:kinase domain protein [Tribonema minus]|uniref:Kinase domain protein n=1 Tax=Tribonema minus TaxID=303371 RepID=A0A835ZC55_9STRA|nr:kinase domain protein [Tribonema minus]